MDERLVLLVVFVMPALMGGLLAWVGASRPVGHAWSGAVRRFAGIRGALAAETGRLVAAVMILFAGTTAIILVCWPLGELAQGLEGPIDVPAYEWMRARSVPDDAWGSLATALTMMGDPQPMRIFVAIAAIAFAVVWWRKGWWIPPVIIVATLEVEWYLQKLLAAVVDRGHPPGATGTYPSGGSARVVAIFGVVFFLILLTRPETSRGWRVVGWTTVALLAALEGYTRFYLLKHWITDIPAGWLFGAVLLLVMAATATALVTPRTTDAEAQRVTAASSTAGSGPV